VRFPSSYAVGVLVVAVTVAACNGRTSVAPPGASDAGAGNAGADAGNPPPLEPDGGSSDGAPAVRRIPPVPPVCSPDGLCWSHPVPTGDGLSSVYGSGPDDVWIVGTRSVIHWDGIAWQTSSLESNVNAVWSSSGADAWAVGDAIWRWDGRSWSEWSAGHEQELRLSVNTLQSIWGASPDDVWAIGSGDVLHWDGTTWSHDTSAESIAKSPECIAGSASNDVWLASSGTMVHWDGQAWSDWGADHDASVFAKQRITAIRGTSAQDIWAVGDVIAHWDGQAWSEAAWPGQPDAGAFSNPGLFAVGAGSSSAAWAGGMRSDQYPQGQLLRWDGSAWSDWGSAHAAELPADLSIGSIWASSPSDVWLVGYALETGWVMHWDGSSWSSLSGARVEKEPALRDVGIGAVWAASARDVWAIGTGSQVYAGPREGRIVHWDGSAWSDLTPAMGQGPAPGGMDLEAIWGASSDDVWAVGVDTILHWDGTSWSDWLAAHPFPEHWYPDEWSAFVADWGAGAMTLEESNQLWSIWGSSSTDVWAAGNVEFVASAEPDGAGGRDEEVKGLLLHWDGTSWSNWTVAHPEVTLVQSLTIWGSSASDIWEGGAYFFASNGELAHFDGVTWSVGGMVPAITYPVPLGIWGSSANDVWAAVRSQLSPRATDLLHWDGAAWSNWTADRGESIQDGLNWAGLGGTSSTDAWLVGQFGTLMHWNGTAWTSLRTPTRELSRVSATAPDDVWITAEGLGAKVLHYPGPR
jgi:hypothetical protein